MAYEHNSPPARSSLDGGDSNARKRVGKACDRCRLKKSKCDGANPCSRCRQDNAICQFGERKKSVDKIYPKGYVELLEQHFSQLVGGLRECYRLLQEGQPWPGEALQLQRDNQPLTHDILERLNVLKSSAADGTMPYEGFEETPERLLGAAKKIMSSGPDTSDTSRSHSLTPNEDDEPTSPVFSGPPFADPWAKPPTNMHLYLKHAQHQGQKLTPELFLNSSGHVQQPMAFQTPIPSRMDHDISMRMESAPMSAVNYDPLGLSGPPEPANMPAFSGGYPWPPPSVRTPADIDWNSWIQKESSYMA